MEEKRNILLFMTDFYGYHKDIVNEMKNQGWEVTWYQDKVKFSVWENVLSKLSDNHKKKKFMRYFDDVLKKEKNNKFDVILIVFGAGFMNGEHIEKLRRNFPDTKIVYYAWDSVSNFPVIKSLSKHADEAFSFDKDDCKKYNINFLPLFYVKKDVYTETVEYKWDVSTVMSFYNKKSQGLLLIMDVIPKNISKYLFIRLRNKSYSVYMRIVNRVAFEKLKKYLTFNSLTREECLSVFKNSKAIMDCPVPNQNGLTMRTFEALALNRKLITTNINVKEYDFYCSDNIFVVDENTKEIPLEFFETPFNKTYSISEKYALSNFVHILIG
ncbi:hypothetical protein [Jutongia sp.]